MTIVALKRKHSGLNFVLQVPNDNDSNVAWKIFQLEIKFDRFFVLILEATSKMAFMNFFFKQLS